MKIKSAEFTTSAPDLRSCPAWPQPEVAFIGRSNVGKSSLINLLTERRELAKVSDVPGKTKLINFFLVNGNWQLVDLPGYGYAAGGQRQRADFNEAVAGFITGRPNLRLVFVLIDSRLPPQAIDLEFLRWLEGVRVPYALIFTKIDKQSAALTQGAIRTFLAAVGEWRTIPPDTLACSTKTKAGRMDVLTYIGKIL